MLFSDVAGQDDIKKYLKHSVAEDNISHGYIFEGPNSIGKLELALVFAQSILCDKFDNEPCNNCNACIKINSSNHPDIHILDFKDKTIKKESVDEIIESIYIRPYESKKKVYIVNNSQNMTLQAANTFLKTLEEPPKDTVIILLTTNSNLLIPTVVSRCQLIKFKNVSKNEIIKKLIDKYNINEQKAKIISDYSKGILNKAIRIVEGKNEILRERDEIIKIVNNVLNSSQDIIYEYENYFEEKKDNIDDVLEIIMIWMRDLSFTKEGLVKLVVNKDYLELLEEQSRKISLEDIANMVQYVQNVSLDVKNHVNYKLVIDKMLTEIQNCKI